MKTCCEVISIDRRSSLRNVWSMFRITYINAEGGRRFEYCAGTDELAAYVRFRAKETQKFKEET